MRRPSRRAVAALLVGAAASVAGALSVAGDDERSGNGVTAPDSEFGTRMAACLREHGWDAEPAQGNSYSVESEAGDREGLARDRAECGRQLGYDVYGGSGG